MISGSHLPSSKLLCRSVGRIRELQLRESNGVVGEKGETPSLADRDLGHHFPAMAIRDVTAAKQIQFVGIEQRFTGSLNFGAHSLNSRIDGLVVHESAIRNAECLRRASAELHAEKVTALLPCRKHTDAAAQRLCQDRVICVSGLARRPLRLS